MMMHQPKITLPWRALPTPTCPNLTKVYCQPRTTQPIRSFHPSKDFIRVSLAAGEVSIILRLIRVVLKRLLGQRTHPEQVTKET